jgi:hypothetical protein
MHSHLAVPIGLMNIGSGPLKYQFDLDKFTAEHPQLVADEVVLFDSSPNSLAAGGKHNSVLHYKPNSVGPISFSLDINVSDFFRRIQSIELAFSGVVSERFQRSEYHQFFKITDELDHLDDFNKAAPEDCYFANDFLDFRDSKPCSANQRMVVLHNPSDSDVLQFNIEDFELTRSGNQRQANIGRAQKRVVGSQVFRDCLLQVQSERVASDLGRRGVVRNQRRPPTIVPP